MADMCDTCGDGVVELLRKILDQDRDTFTRLGQIVASGGGGGGGNVNLTGINGVAPSVGNGTSDAGVIRVAQVSDGTGILAQITDIRQPTASNLNAQVVGNVAHDAVDSGNPVKIGGKARTSVPTAVADNDRVDASFDKFGRIVCQHGIRDVRAQQITTITSSTAETTVVTADATYMRDVYGLIVTNTSSTATSVAFKDSTGGTTRFTIMVPAQETRGFMLPACDGHKQAAVNNNWTATCGTSVASVIITVFTVGNPS